MLPILQVGPLAIQLSGLLLITGVWVGILLVERAAPRFKISPALVNNMIFYGLIAGILGARLGYVLRYIDAFAGDPLSILALNPNMLSIPEGLLAGLITSVIYGQRKGLPLWSTLDALTPGVAVFMLALALAHLSSGDAFGAPTSLPWAINLWGRKRHPSQVYEIMGAVIILLIMLRLQRHRWVAGFQALSFMALSAAARLFLEAFRGDSILLFGGLRQAQLSSLAILIIALIVIRLRVRTSTWSA
jgi:phosphatidylglycerol:prolipoprotein diacylglycerol transferase